MVLTWLAHIFIKHVEYTFTLQNTFNIFLQSRERNLKFRFSKSEKASEVIRFLAFRRHKTALWPCHLGEMIRSKCRSDQKFSREFFEKSPFWLSQKAHIFIMRWLSDRYKNTLFFAKISPREVFVQKNRFSEPVFCQKTQQWEDAANIRLQVSFLLLSFYVSFYSSTFLLFYLYLISSIFTKS